MPENPRPDCAPPHMRQLAVRPKQGNPSAAKMLLGLWLAMDACGELMYEEEPNPEAWLADDAHGMYFTLSLFAASIESQIVRPAEEIFLWKGCRFPGADEIAEMLEAYCDFEHEAAAEVE